MRQGLAQFDAALAVAGPPPLDDGSGVHFGEVRQGPSCSQARREFPVIGDIIHTVSRLESAMKALSLGVVLSAHAVERLSPSRGALMAPQGEVQSDEKAQGVPVEGLRSG
ncbi:MAG: hypothetical protein INH41_19810 [Myxococcaceae bacterium]|nr:hypothetical protein [Myxococcaceae bacterium]